MAGIYGHDPIFDYKFTYYEKPKVCKKELSHNSLAYLIREINPDWFYLLKKADLDWRLDDVQFNATVFLPQAHSINSNIILNSDKNTARSIVKYHMMMGIFPKEVLETSQGQKLASTVKGQDVYVFWPNRDEMYINNTSHVIQFDIRATNGIIHIIDTPLHSDFYF